MWCLHVAAGPLLQILWIEKYFVKGRLAIGQGVVTIPRQFHNIKNHPNIAMTYIHKLELTPETLTSMSQDHFYNTPECAWKFRQSHR